MSDSEVTVLPRIITPWDSLGQYIEVWRGDERVLCWGPYACNSYGGGAFTRGEFEAGLKEAKARFPEITHERE